MNCLHIIILYIIIINPKNQFFSMKKKDYQTPTILVVKLQQQTQLLAGSPLTNPSDYPDGGNPFIF